MEKEFKKKMFFILWKFKETFIKTSQKETFYKIVLNLSD